MSQIKTCLGFDPGKINTGWAVYHRTKRLTHSGVIDGLDTVELVPVVHKQVTKLFKTFKPDCCCIERFHSQFGRGSKKNFELVNLTIGIILGYCLAHKVPFKLVTASTHKRWISKEYVVKKRPVKERGRGRIKRTYDIRTYKEWSKLETEHEVDAANIAKYALTKVFNKGAETK